MRRLGARSRARLTAPRARLMATKPKPVRKATSATRLTSCSGEVRCSHAVENNCDAINACGHGPGGPPRNGCPRATRPSHYRSGPRCGRMRQPSLAAERAGSLPASPQPHVLAGAGQIRPSLANSGQHWPMLATHWPIWTPSAKIWQISPHTGQCWPNAAHIGRTWANIDPKLVNVGELLAKFGPVQPTFGQH